MLVNREVHQRPSIVSTAPTGSTLSKKEENEKVDLLDLALTLGHLALATALLRSLKKA